MAEAMVTVQRKTGDHAMHAVHESEREWETLRFPGQHSKMLFHPRPEQPTEPNAGFVRYEPGAHHPLHRHDFAQVWYILEGTFTIGGRTYGPGTMVHHPDPHFEHDLSTETGGSCCSCSIRDQAPAAARSTTPASTAPTAPTRRPRTATAGSRCRSFDAWQTAAGSARSPRASTARRPTAATARRSTRIAPSSWRGSARTRRTPSFSSRFDRYVTRP